MKSKLPFIILLFPLLLSAQNNNGSLDMIEEFSTRLTVPIPMRDGTKLMTDIYLPITSDALRINTEVFGIEISVELIPKGTQLVQYPTLTTPAGVIPNPKPYQVPLVFTRTPYNKTGDIVGPILAILGYSYALQDMRGRYSSEGVYFPMHSDSWDKTPYRGALNHLLDPLPAEHPSNANKHEDGWDSYQYILNNLKVGFDPDNNGSIDFYDNPCNGSMGMFGASALGNTQLQLVAAHRVSPDGPGMKCLFPIVATSEHYGSTGFNNGVLREGLVKGWVYGQFSSGVREEGMNEDNSILNNLHTPRDYNRSTLPEIMKIGVDHFTTHAYDGLLAGLYPNNFTRSDMDVSFAPVNADGEGDANGTHSRYKNMNVPIYHLSGWYDIFVNGQIDSWKKIRAHADPKVNKKQKIVIGPWAHQTIGSTTTGDVTYPANVNDVIGISFDNLELDNIPLGRITHSEVLSWYRSQLNYNDYKNIGEPVYRIPKSTKWQNIAGVGEMKVPAKDYDLTLTQLVGFMTGAAPLPNIPVEVRVLGFLVTPIDLPVPQLESPLLKSDGNPFDGIRRLNFEEVPDCRYYVMGPNDDPNPENAGVGNYWKSTDDFPFSTGISWQSFYLHQNGQVNLSTPDSDEGLRTLIADPNSPVYSIGGCNMAESTPQKDRESQGQINLADERYNSFAYTNPGVLQYTSPAFTDTLSFIGFPKATIYAKSMPAGALSGEPTDTDFFVRIADEYPDGRVMFVCEGAVNARAREYAREIYKTGVENIGIPFTNIRADVVYAYQFELLPIAYTFGKGHKMKVLISSNNHPRYQTSANIPMEEGEFYRHVPGDDLNYTFNGKTFKPRIANNSLHCSPAHASRIELPLYNSTPRFEAPANPPAPTAKVEHLFPNPASTNLQVAMSAPGNYTLTLTNMLGQTVLTQAIDQNYYLHVGDQPNGVYVLQVSQAGGEVLFTQKWVIQH